MLVIPLPAPVPEIPPATHANVTFLFLNGSTATLSVALDAPFATLRATLEVSTWVGCG